MASCRQCEEGGLRKGGCSPVETRMPKTIESYREAALFRLRSLEVIRGVPEIPAAISILESPQEALNDSYRRVGEH